MAHKSHKSKFSIEIALLGTIIGSGVCFAAFHGTRILAQHNDVIISKKDRLQFLTRPSPNYVDHDRAVAHRLKLHSVHEEP